MGNVDTCNRTSQYVSSTAGDNKSGSCVYLSFSLYVGHSIIAELQLFIRNVIL